MINLSQGKNSLLSFFINVKDLEASIRRYSIKKCTEFFRKTHRKTHVSESPVYVCSCDFLLNVYESHIYKQLQGNGSLDCAYGK